MEYEILEGKTPVGTLCIRQQGLYLHIQGQFSKEKALQRVYGIGQDRGIYLGIIDLKGSLEKRLPAGATPMPESCILSPLGPEDWEREQYPEPKTEQVLSHSSDREEKASQAVQTENIYSEKGERNYEDIQEKHCTCVDPLLLADLPADYDYGQGGQGEADRTDL